jgi:two-component system, cell cycle sensor histidine kinase and response regulator CckA
MDEKNLTPQEPPADDSQEIRLLDPKDVATETIDLDNLFGAELTTSASFDFTWIEQAAFGKLLEAIPVPAFLVDSIRLIVFANRSLMKITPDYNGLKGQPFVSIFPNAAEAARAETLLDSIFLDRKPKYLEGVVTILGQRIWGRMHLRAIRVAEQRLILVLVEDLTAEKRQVILNDKYRKLVHMLPIGTAEFVLYEPVSCGCSEDQALGAVLQAALVDGNDEFAGIHRAAGVEELIGVRLDRLFPYESRNRDLYNKWIKSGFGIRSAEIATELPDGSHGYIECTFIGIVKRGRLFGFWLLKRDSTENHRMKEESFRAQKLESLGILAGGIAHDFNNSLTAILGNINLAKLRATSGDPLFQRLVEAERACSRAKSLTDQLLTFAKGGMPIKRVGSVASLLKESVAFALRGSNVGCEFSIPPDLWAVEFDEGQMSQVINNLIINACQAMPDGGIIAVKAQNVVGYAHDSESPDQPGRHVKISITDHGVGIPAENMERIFDPYFTTKKKGTGLGLATSYAIIRSHSGWIGVDSEPASGSTFHIHLPASEREIHFRKLPIDSPQGGMGRILLMEDEPMVRDVAHEMLSLMGYEVSSVRDGMEAITEYKKAMAEDRPFAAVIMNLTVPGGMGAKEAVGELLKIDPHAKAIVSSGYANDPVMESSACYGFKGVVSKPYDLDELTAVLHRVVTEDPS